MMYTAGGGAVYGKEAGHHGPVLSFEILLIIIWPEKISVACADVRQNIPMALFTETEKYRTRKRTRLFEETTAMKWPKITVRIPDDEAYAPQIISASVPMGEGARAARTIFIVDGGSATGKSAIQQHVLESHPRIAAIRKFTTRTPGDKGASEVDADQILVSDEEFDTLAHETGFLWYEFAGYRYGLRLGEILHASISSSRDVLVIIRDIDTIKKLKKWAVGKAVAVVATLVLSGYAARRGRLERLNHSDKTIEMRLNRDDGAYTSNRKMLQVYDEVLENDADLPSLFARFMAIVNRRRIPRKTWRSNHPQHSWG